MSAIRMTPEEYKKYMNRHGWSARDLAEVKLAPQKRAVSALEAVMGSQIERAPSDIALTYRRQFHPIDGRDFKADFAWVEKKILLECDGAVHRIKGRFHADQERNNLLTLAGWRVLHVGMKHIEDGRAMSWLLQLWGTDGA